MKEIFTKIYKENAWMSKESASGTGSELATTVELRDRLPRLFDKYHIRRVLDLGCGDFNWMYQVALKLDKYLGVDVVEEIIQKNQEQYSTNKIQFTCFDITKFTNFNDYDAIIVRDVLVHFSYIDIWTILDRIMGSDSIYLLTTNFLAETKNIDIPTGLWRRLNLLLHPFFFPPPIETIISYSEPYNIRENRYYDKTLSMWFIRQLKEALRR